MPGIRLDGCGTVVTGAGGGIGAALARRLAAEGALVVVNDVDREAAEGVAEEVGGIAVAGDAADGAVVDRLVTTAERHFGAVDLFCANAGVAPMGGPEQDDAVWETAWRVNVLAHVHAARRLLPAWLERGRGHLLATVSAAGLLTMLGSAPYSVTKHASLGFAEWLSATYGSRGITVQALCPQGVATDMLAATGRAGQVVLEPGAITPEQVAEAAVAGLADGRFLILPHPEVADYYLARASDTDRWLAGMRRLQDRIVHPHEPPPHRSQETRTLS